MDNQNTQLDPSVVNLARAIRQTESGGDFSAKGASGEHGAYQFTSDTWNSEAPKYGINVPIEKATPEQQNAVAYNKIKEWKDGGKDVTNIASMWNAGEGEPDAYTGKFSNGKSSIGTNKFGVKYDVPAYAKSVAGAYLKLKNGEQVGADPNNPSSIASTVNNPIKDTIVGSPTTPETQTPDTTAPGSFIDNVKKGHFGDALGSGIRDIGSALTFGGTEKLGNETGASLAILGNKARGLFGGQDNSKYIPQPDVGNALKGAAGIVGGTGLLAGGSILGDAFKAKSALANPEVTGILKDSLGLGENVSPEITQQAVKAIPRQQAIDALSDALKNQPVSDAGGKTEQAILKAIQELNPTSIEKKSILSKLAKGGYNIAKSAVLAKVLGPTIGGLFHSATNK